LFLAIQFKTFFGETTANQHASTLKLSPGINGNKIQTAINLFTGLPVIEASDGARCLRFLEPRMLEDRHFCIVGEMWHPDVATWNKEKTLLIPRKEEKTTKMTSLH